METLFDEDIWVHYSQFYLTIGESYPEDMGAAFAGQSNGLCGSGVAGSVFFVTGLHTGTVPLTVVSFDSRPEPVGAWEDIVEVSLVVDAGPVRILSWGGEQTAELAVEPGHYRLRYCVSGMDAGREADTRLEDDGELDRYLVQLWPEPPSDDIVVRQSSATAAYWHESNPGPSEASKPSPGLTIASVVESQPHGTVAAPPPTSPTSTALRSTPPPKLVARVESEGLTAELRIQPVATAMVTPGGIRVVGRAHGGLERLPVGPLPKAGYVKCDYDSAAMLVVDGQGHTEVVDNWNEGGGGSFHAAYQTAVGTLLWGIDQSLLVAPGRRERIGSANRDVRVTVSNDGVQVAVVESKFLRSGNWWRPSVVTLTDGSVTPLPWNERNEIYVHAFHDGVLYVSAERSDDPSDRPELFHWPLGGQPHPLEGDSGPLQGLFRQRDPLSGLILIDAGEEKGLFIAEPDGTQRLVSDDRRSLLTPGGDELYRYSVLPDRNGIDLRPTRGGEWRTVPLPEEVWTGAPSIPVWEDAHHVLLATSGPRSVVGFVRVDTSTGTVEAIPIHLDPPYRPCLVEPFSASVG